MHPSIASKKPQIAEVCRNFHVRRLEVFGSAARGDDFDPERSDADFLVEFESDTPVSLFDAYFGLQRALETLLGREVDLITLSAIDNPFVRASIDQSRELVHDA
ncbi:MAG: nucleotidyltransferase domain-containing protein [Pseudomonadota bacterium]|nr:nucleotidyltransferase domain-containing protein [Pseudomonadota bacterium]